MNENKWDKWTKGQEIWWQCTKNYIQEMTYIDYMCQERRRGFGNIENCKDSLIQEPKDNIKKSKEKLIKTPNRCIRSNISGDDLDCGWVELGADATLTGNRWASNNDITRWDRKFSQFGVSCCSLRQWESALSRGLGPQAPRLSSPAERERSAAKDRGTGDQYVAVFVQSPSHLSHITLS